MNYWAYKDRKRRYSRESLPLQVLQLIIFAGLAAIVLYQLYSVLGRRKGLQPEDRQTVEALERRAPAPVLGDTVDDGVELTGLAAVRAKDPAFDVTRFLSGAKSAYEMIVKAFAEGDRATLKNLLAPSVFDSFDSAITQREAEGRTEQVEFFHSPRADLERADVRSGDLAHVTVRFLAEFRSRTKGPEGEGVDDRRTAELWTFERRLKSRDPNWTLVHVDAAEA
jgi:predicted lipid-binding transport protein (Tim44 family)